MKIIEISGENRLERHTMKREACRGIVLVNGKLLLSYETSEDQWLIPGGGMEPGETPEECCIRELAEETGLIVRPLRHYLTIKEYYDEWCFVSHYFVCEAVNNTQRALTEQEQAVGLEPRWLPLEDALEIFSRYSQHSGMRRGAYLREYQALCCL